MLAVECCPASILRADNSFDCRKVALAERIIMLAKETFAPRMALNGIDPIVHDSPADECRHQLRPVPSMKKQSIAVVRAVIHGKLHQCHLKPSRLFAIIRRDGRCLLTRFAPVGLGRDLAAPPSFSHLAMEAVYWRASRACVRRSSVEVMYDMWRGLARITSLLSLAAARLSATLDSYRKRTRGGSIPTQTAKSGEPSRPLEERGFSVGA